MPNVVGLMYVQTGATYFTFSLLNLSRIIFLPMELNGHLNLVAGIQPLTILPGKFMLLDEHVSLK